MRRAEQQFLRGLPGLRLGAPPPASLSADANVEAGLRGQVSHLGHLVNNFRLSNAYIDDLERQINTLSEAVPRDDAKIDKLRDELMGAKRISSDWISAIQTEVQNFDRSVRTVSNMSAKWDKTVGTAVNNMKA